MSLLEKQTSIWFMRQAGRYLPEYMEISKKMSFFEMCNNPEIAATITMQPITRFDMDAAIIFSDILVLPKALGVDLDIKKLIGPVIKPIESISDLKMDKFDELTQPTSEAIKYTKKLISSSGKSLIGFAGAPWTIALYIINGQWDKTFSKCRIFINERKDEFREIISLITDATILYLKKQVESGADFVQIFDSFASVASFEEFKEFIIAPTKKIIDAMDVPVIGFPRLCGASYLDYTQETGVDIISTDSSLSVEWIRDNLSEKAIIQGNLDPYLLAYDIETALKQTDKILNCFKTKKFIFNLGHGVLKETKVSHVERIVERIKNWNICNV